MRSLLLSRFLKLKQPPLVHRQLQYLSDSPLCHVIGAEHCGSSLRDRDVGKLVICSLSATPHGIKVIETYPSRWKFNAPGCGKEVLEKTVPMDLMKKRATIGASHGWVATLKDGIVRLQDDLIPSASDSDPKRISLPPLVTLPHCQTQLVTNVAMSTSSPEDDDCIVAVKFLGPQLSLCRPDKSEWVNIRIDDPAFFSSRVMYSKRDQMFSMVASGGTHTGSWDLEKHISHNLWYPYKKEFRELELDSFLHSRRSEHLVESPKGQTYMVKWYTAPSERKTGAVVSERFLVFKIINNDYAVSTTNIEDLCIFLSYEGEPFCLQASLYDLSPNFLYFLGSHDYGKDNIGKSHRFVGFSSLPAPYFIPPQP